MTAIIYLSSLEGNMLLLSMEVITLFTYIINCQLVDKVT